MAKRALVEAKKKDIELFEQTAEGGKAPGDPLELCRSKTRRVRQEIKIIKAVGVAVLMVWALILLLKSSQEEAALDLAPRIGIDEFLISYRQSGLSDDAGTIDKRQTKALYLIDVRRDTAYREGHIEGATLIPEGEVAGRIRSVVPDKASMVVLYCA